jgi:AcrR family transcriptional regulator
MDAYLLAVLIVDRMADQGLPGRIQRLHQGLHEGIHEGLRERKKRRTRRALADAAMRLFAERGYEATTIADIAAAADVSTRTFFSYFRSKDDVLFAETDERIALIPTLFAARAPDEPLLAVLRRLLTQLMETAVPNLAGDQGGARMQILAASPELQARALQRLLTAERVLAEALRSAYPELDDTSAVAVSAALIGTLRAVAMHSAERGDSPDELLAAMAQALSLIEHGLGSVDGRESGGG